MGFGREMKDFIAAYQAGDKIKGAKDDREYKKQLGRIAKQKADDAEDPEMRQLQKNILKGRAVRLNRAIDPNLSASRALDVKLKQKQLDILNTPEAPAPGPQDTVPGAGPGAPPSAVGPQSDAGPDAAPDGGEFNTAEVSPDLMDGGDSTGAIPSSPDEPMMASRGGMIRKPAKAVKRYADGGSVESDDTADEGTDDSSGDSEADRLDYEDSREDGQGYSPQAGHDAALVGMKYAAAAHGHTPPAGALDTDFSGARRRAGSAAYLRGDGAATPDEMAAVRHAIDPEGKMSESERNFAALSHVYSYYLDKNEPERAQRAAASMVQHYRIASDRYQAIAKVAADNGDVNGAVKNILKAHANVPDGKDLKLTSENGKIGYSFTDVQSGKTVEKGIASPDEILQWASKGGIRNFDSLVAAAGGQRAGAAKGGGGGGGGMKQSDKVTLGKSIDDAWTTMKDDVGDKTEDAPGTADLKSNAFAIAAAPQNARLSPHEAVIAVRNIAVPNPSSPYKAGFSMQSVDGGAQVRFDNGSHVFVPQEQFDRLALIRAQKLKGYTSEADKTTADSGRHGALVDRIKKSATEAGAAVSKFGADYVSRMKSNKARADMEARPLDD